MYYLTFFSTFFSRVLPRSCITTVLMGVILAMCWIFKSKEIKQILDDFSRRMKAFANPPSDIKTGKGSNKI